MARTKRKYNPSPNQEVAKKRKIRTDEGQKNHDTKINKAKKKVPEIPASPITARTPTRLLQDEAQQSERATEGVKSANGPAFTPNVTVSSPTSQSINPLLASLETKFKMCAELIRSSTSIQQKVTKILGVLSNDTPSDALPPLVVINAKTGTASKAISIAEIAKRELGKRGHVWYQYSAVYGVEVKLQRDRTSIGKRKDRPTKDGPEVDGATAEGGPEDTKPDGDVSERPLSGMSKEEDDAAEEAFETMAPRNLSDRNGNPGERPKIRVVPALRIYLAKGGIEELRSKHGEQSNAKA